MTELQERSRSYVLDVRALVKRVLGVTEETLFDEEGNPVAILDYEEYVIQSLSPSAYDFDSEEDGGLYFEVDKEEGKPYEAHEIMKIIEDALRVFAEG